MLKNECDIFNYADDNTVCCYGENSDVVKIELQQVVVKLLKWFHDNNMKVNCNKFQFMLFGNGSDNDSESIVIAGHTVHAQTIVKLLGVHFDVNLNFDFHVQEICKKAGRKLNVLRRLSNNLDESNKLVLFYSFILSNLEYCSVVWHFCNKGSMKKIEKIL